ncbi:hypothetical protein TNCV_4228991 [Trichonephila clavipes]|nr:hypothetical protein TNCV_4228991 [Trichonephila clavipes]
MCEFVACLVESIQKPGFCSAMRNRKIFEFAAEHFKKTLIQERNITRCRGSDEICAFQHLKPLAPGSAKVSGFDWSSPRGTLWSESHCLTSLEMGAAINQNLAKIAIYTKC